MTAELDAAHRRLRLRDAAREGRGLRLELVAEVVEPDPRFDLVVGGELKFDLLARLEGEAVLDRDVRRVGGRDDERVAVVLATQREREHVVLLREGRRHLLQDARVQVVGGRRRDRKAQLLAQRAQQAFRADEAHLQDHLPEAPTPLTLVAKRGLQLQLVDELCVDEQLTQALSRHR